MHERRRTLCDAAIQLLAEHGAKGLSHPRVDRQAGVADGSTSYYFRTRQALVHAVAERIAELDLADLEAATLPDYAVVVMKSITGEGLTRTRARFELLLQSWRDPQLSEIFARNAHIYAQLHRDLVAQVHHDLETDSERVATNALITMNFISGLMITAAAGARPMQSHAELEEILRHIVSGTD